MKYGGIVLKTVKKACVFIGMVVGAGFASGREIVDYFLVYSDRWKIGVFISGILFFLVFWAVTEIINRNGISEYSAYLSTVMSKRTALFTEWASGLFFFVMFFAMASASAAMAREMFGLNGFIGSGLLLVVCAAVMLNGIKALETVSILLVPLLTVGIVAIGFTAGGQTTALIADRGGSVTLSAVIYVSYNTISAASVIMKLDGSKSRLDGVLTGIICGGAMTFMGIIIGNAVLGNAEAINNQLPFAFVSKSCGRVYYLVYIAVFMASVLTTALCDGMAAISFVEEKIRIGRLAAVLIITVFAAVLSNVGFSAFVSKIYPIFGFAGVLQLVGTLGYFVKKN